MVPSSVKAFALLVAALAAAGLAPRPATASEGSGPDTTIAAAKDGPNPWLFRAAAYGWLMSVSGNLTAHGQTVDLDTSFIQLVQKSDSLVALMGYFEADKGPVGFYTDVVWAKLGFTNSTAAYRNPIPGLKFSVTANAALTYSMTIIEAGVSTRSRAGPDRRARSPRSMRCWAFATGTTPST